MAACLLTLVQQLKLLSKEGHCPSFLSVVSTRVTPISVVLPSKLLSAMLSSGFVASYFPATDLVKLQEEGIDFGILHIVLFFVSIGLVATVAAAAWGCVAAFGRAAHKIAAGFFAASGVPAGEMVADAALTGLSRVGKPVLRLYFSELTY